MKSVKRKFKDEIEVKIEEKTAEIGNLINPIDEEEKEKKTKRTLASVWKGNQIRKTTVTYFGAIL